MNAAVPSKLLLRGWHVFAMLAVFFLTVAAVDGIMITKAVSTFSGDTADAYRKGLAYNETLKEEAQQDQLGWRESRTFDSKTGRLSITLVDESGKPLDGLRLDAEIGRAVTGAFDRRVSLDHSDGGIYSADLGGLSEGGWVLSLTASDRDTVVYRSRARIWKQP